MSFKGGFPSQNTIFGIKDNKSKSALQSTEVAKQGQSQFLSEDGERLDDTVTTDTLPREEKRRIKLKRTLFRISLNDNIEGPSSEMSITQGRSKKSRSPDVDDDRGGFLKSTEPRSDEKKLKEKLKIKSYETFKRRREKMKEFSVFRIDEDDLCKFRPYYEKVPQILNGHDRSMSPKQEPQNFHPQQLSPRHDKRSSSRERGRSMISCASPSSVARENKRSSSRSFSITDLDDFELPDLNNTRSVSSSRASDQCSDFHTDRSLSNFDMVKPRSSERNLTSQTNKGIFSIHYESKDEVDKSSRKSEVNLNYFSRENLRHEDRQKSQNGPPNRPMNSKESLMDIRANMDVGCINCFSNSHNLESCKGFHRMSMKERWDLIVNYPEKICQACLQQDHLIQDCFNKNKCSQISPHCKDPLHPLLHICLRPICFVCRNGDHGIQDCETFLDLELHERWKAIRSRKVCTICLKMDHLDDECTWPTTCPKSKVCTIQHHPLLHKCKTKVEPGERESSWDQAHPRDDNRTLNQSSLFDSRIKLKSNNDTQVYREFNQMDSIDQSMSLQSDKVKYYEERSDRQRNFENSNHFDHEDEFVKRNFSWRGLSSRGTSEDSSRRDISRDSSLEYSASNQSEKRPLSGKDWEPSQKPFMEHKPQIPSHLNHSIEKLHSFDIMFSESRQLKENSQTLSCPRIESPTNREKQKNGLESLYAHFYHSMKASGLDTSSAWEMSEAWRSAGHSESSLRNLIEKHKPKSREVLEKLLVAELSNRPGESILEVNLQLLVCETIKFLEKDTHC